MTDEWISVSDYAARRHISERQARRIVAALPEDLRSPPEERPARVKWCPATSGSASGVSGQMSEESAVLDTIAPDLPRPGADRWQDCPAESPAMSGTSPADAQYQAVAKSLEVLQEQLAKKDEQIADKDRFIQKQADKISELTDQQAATIRELTALADQAQQLHRGDQLGRAVLKQIEPPRQNFVQRWLAAWKDQRTDQ